jgi:chaperonin GroES
MLRPVGARVLVRPEKVEKRTDSGLYLPEQTQERKQFDTQKGEVVSIGPLAFKDFGDGSNWCEVGDTIYFVRYAGVVHEVTNGDGEKVLHRVINDEDIMGIDA